MITIEGDNLRINDKLVDFNALYSACNRLSTAATVHYTKGIYAILINTYHGIKLNRKYVPITEEKLLKYLDLLERSLQTGYIVR